MKPIHTFASPWCLYVSLLLLTLTSRQQAYAASIASEHEQLTALTRQIDLADRMASQAASNAPQERSRYYFDYLRLHADLKQVRTGVQDYLVPQRAQPRDPIPLSGNYVGESLRTDEVSP
ncbi:RAQPRD family integrative conjugative element protein [Sodalis sp. RH19]|uniref:integrative conjugative element protein, RAQPRD family n=1 Tax=Sodalis sp. RH19 TaxID=3394334 RepID=UPI0039B6800B